MLSIETASEVDKSNRIADQGDVDLGPPGLEEHDINIQFPDGHSEVTIDLSPEIIRQLRNVSYALGLKYPEGVIDEIMDWLAKNPDIDPESYQLPEQNS